VFFVLSKLLDVVLSPYSWGLVFLAGAIPWRARSARRWRRRRVVGALGLAILLVASSWPFSNALAWRLEHALPSTYREDVTYDAVVLLGGVVDEEVAVDIDQPVYNENVERLVMTHKLLVDGKARTTIISGGSVDPALARFGDAVVLGRQLEDWGIAKDRIILDDRAKNTRENAVNVQALARAHGFSRVLIVTSAFHMVRAAECFAAVGMKVDTLAVDYRAHKRLGGLSNVFPRAIYLSTTTAMVREIAGRVVYRVQGYGKAVE
jgi:uncharacterized SAM-binding protein YcdF (DUF218 family)